MYIQIFENYVKKKSQISYQKIKSFLFRQISQGGNHGTEDLDSFILGRNIYK